MKSFGGYWKVSNNRICCRPFFDKGGERYQQKIVFELWWNSKGWRRRKSFCSKWNSIFLWKLSLLRRPHKAKMKSKQTKYTKCKSFNNRQQWDSDSHATLLRVVCVDKRRRRHTLHFAGYWKPIASTTCHRMMSPLSDDRWNYFYTHISPLFEFNPIQRARCSGVYLCHLRVLKCTWWAALWWLSFRAFCVEDTTCAWQSSARTCWKSSLLQK